MPFAGRHVWHPVAADSVGITPAAQNGVASRSAWLHSFLRSPGMQVGQHGDAVPLTEAKVWSPVHSGGMVVRDGHWAGRKQQCNERAKEKTR
jgi:hypothetical protein